MRTKRLVVLLMAMALVAAACGREDDTGAQEPESVELTAIDYGYQGVPSSVAAGSTLTLHNASSVEFHEVVAFRLADDEDRPLSELMALPEEEMESIFPEGPPATVIVAMPNEDGEAVVGDGTISQPGRYALICFIPTGADPAEIVAAIEELDDDEEPDFGGGPPHFTQGMYAELNVE